MVEDAIFKLAVDTLNKNKQCFVFVNSKRSAEKEAEELSKKLKLQSKELDELSEKLLHALSRPTVQCERLAKCAKKGVVFHHAGLCAEQRELIEDSFRHGLIKIICCTPTLAAGVDLPAFRTIIRDLKRYGHEGYEWIPVLEFLQMAGRAGRPSFDNYGEAICIAGTEAEMEEIIDRYFNGYPESIYSKLAVEPVLRTYLLSLIASGFVRNKKQILDFFEKTFWAHQFKDMQKLESIIEKMLALLTNFKFIIRSNKSDDFVSASDIVNETVAATLLGHRVAELYIDPITANHLIECMKKKEEISNIAFLHMICRANEMRPLLKVKNKDLDLVNQEIVKVSDELLEAEPPMFDYDYADFINAFKTSLMLLDWIEEHDEEDLFEKFGIRPGELRVKLDNADWLLYSSVELARIEKLKILPEINKIRTRVMYGVKPELLTLLRLKDIGRVRARKLYNNGIKDLGDIKKADVKKLASIIGSKLAVSVKTQVGQKIEEEVKEVKESKLYKGQTTLEHH